MVKGLKSSIFTGKLGKWKLFSKLSLCRRRNLTFASNVRKAAEISLFWAPNGLNELPEVKFEFPFILIGKSTMAFLTGQS